MPIVILYCKIDNTTIKVLSNYSNYGSYVKYHNIIFKLNVLCTSTLIYLPQESARSSGLLLWTLTAVADLTIITVDKEKNQRSGSDSEIRSEEDVDLGSRFHTQPIEGIELDVTEAETVTATTTLNASRLLLTLLCLGDKTNEAAVFRALPESFSTFLSLHPSHNIAPAMDLDLDSNLDLELNVIGSGSATTSGTQLQKSSLNAANSIPSLKRLFQGQGQGQGLGQGQSQGQSQNPGPGQGQVRKGPVRKMSLISSTNDSGKISTSIPSSASDSPVLKSSGSQPSRNRNAGIESSGCVSALLSANGSDVRATYAVKMGLHDKGSH